MAVMHSVYLLFKIKYVCMYVATPYKSWQIYCHTLLWFESHEVFSHCLSVISHIGSADNANQ